jgi:hypothetical protein
MKKKKWTKWSDHDAYALKMKKLGWNLEQRQSYRRGVALAALHPKPPATCAGVTSCTCARNKWEKLWIMLK